MTESWLLKNLPIIFFILAHFVIGLQFGVVFLNAKDEKKKVEKKSVDKSDEFLVGLLIGSFFF